MLESILVISIVALVLLVWFESEAFVEYIMLFRLGGFFRVRSYTIESEGRPSLTYLSYLREESGPRFLISLISCPLCSSFWVTILVTYLVTDSLWLFPAYNILSLIVYKLTSRALQL